MTTSIANHNLTLGDLQKPFRSILDDLPLLPDPAPNIHIFHGIRIVENNMVPKAPRQQLSDKIVDMFKDLGHPEHIAPLNQMLCDMFGEDEQMLRVYGDIHVLPETWAKIKRAVQESDATYLNALGLKL